MSEDEVIKPVEEAMPEGDNETLGSVDSSAEMTLDQMKEMLANMEDGPEKEELAGKIAAAEQAQG